MSAPRPTSTAVACFEKREQHALAGIVRHGADKCLYQRILSKCRRAIPISNVSYNVNGSSSVAKKFANDTSNCDRCMTNCVANRTISRRESRFVGLKLLIISAASSVDAYRKTDDG